MTLANSSVDESNIIYNINESTTHYLNMSIIKIGNNEPVRLSTLTNGDGCTTVAEDASIRNS